MADVSPIDQYSHPQRRTSSCPDLRDGIIMTPRSPPTSSSEWHKIHAIDDDLVPRTHTVGGSPVVEAAPPDEEADITEVQVESSGNIPTVEIASPESIQRNEEHEPDLPAPTWDDYPPAPNIHPLRPWHWRFWWYGTRRVLGYEGTPSQKENVSLFWKVLIDLAQIVVSIVFLVISAHTPSRTDPSISERAACKKPLSAWITVWIVKRCASAGRSVWATRRQKLARYLKSHPIPPGDVEASAAERPPTPNPAFTSLYQVQGLEAESTHSTPHQNTTTDTNRNNRGPPSPQLPHTLLFNRISLLLALFGVAWWIASQVFLYSSSDCRESSPHTWWTLFALVCVQYIALAELVFFAVLVFFVVPIALLIVNSFLLCLGRPPVQAPTRIHPEIGKLPKETVARIPLVLYIPHPHQSWIPQSQTSDVHSYPPKATPSPSPSRPASVPTEVPIRSRPKWIPFLSETHRKPTDEWDNQWEAGAYPFVRLSGSRAVCHVCLEEFQEPKRRGAETKRIEDPEKADGQKPKSAEEKVKRSIASTLKRPHRKSSKATGRDPLKLEDAGNGAQPLRLLECGHVFHRSCIDPWLTDVSGRCPVCQRAVELDHHPEPEIVLPDTDE